MAKKQSPPLTVFILVVFLCLLLVFLNVNIWKERSEKRRYLSTIREELQTTVGQTETVQIYDADDPLTIERVAREQLLMAREGEEVVVILRRENEEEEEEEEEPGFFEQLMDIIR